MRIIVFGAGVVGVATAYRLAREGHEVVVIDRRPGAGLETSFANGGQISASHAEPWASPATLLKVLQWLGRPDAPLVFRWTRWDPFLWVWLARFLRNCTPARTHRNIERTLRLALYSRTMLKALRAETGIAYDHRTSGILHIYRMPRAFAQACAAAATMQLYGLERRVCPVAACLALEPALVSVAPQLAGGLYSPDDESGDAHLFTVRLAELARTAGVDFRFGVTVRGLEAEGGHIVRVVTDHGAVTGTAYVLALGSYSALVARTVGLRLPIYPAKGYSLTVDATGFAGAPAVSITDDEYKMVYTRLGNRLRIAGTAELAGWDPTPTPIRAETLLKRAHAMFPEGGDYDHAVLWAGLRPKTPDSVPIIGRTPWPELLLNTGHGTLGWTMAAGSACIIADLIADRPPAIALEGLGGERF
ncbi:MAG: D-amino-acid dehydrogenase [Rhodospirillaceae bacterium]|nr:MAG: D-amino-acid dehydrogenase [Rhodospirillaceae bacterium]